MHRKARCVFACIERCCRSEIVFGRSQMELRGIIMHVKFEEKLFARGFFNILILIIYTKAISDKKLCIH